ncbi:UDP-N-acetylmuramoyl-L-alanyl-D-glutamate--2,6-diaminopimelate ligase [Salipaludibacillus keqinensis]|uniref:UDP-N-acetylmuramoyl-L-alanyl-D-glutamate--2,6-diaminopimelate ligase n=1 Tax=Salipaludibacillus keqinensis TaxID=2045207 RepID=A0A323TH62_9BACI|nr:UDP-N-acetylmuramoyl-L-alanyl-D-glutamate--2,6-diaminopimelate ligase [Salipaludibacillus keqinensis]PYZ93244.1 UDP-N-acetylmuramoyl-L-alanyl-D-glutamate--2,6-diaminopimelate ligase [Salipaludibacillus keqinensis]
MEQLKKLTEVLPTFKYIGEENPFIESLEMDSRKVEKGCLFFCIPGFTVDGHDYAEKAIQAGAVALVVEKELPLDVPMIKVRDAKRTMAILSAHFYQLPSSNLHMIGITGTNGKTTTTHVIHKIMSDHQVETAIIGTMYMKYKGKEIAVANTTPESLVLQKEYAHMVEAGVEAVTMEVSSHALELGRVHGTEFNIGVFTNLSQDHLDYHKTMEKYAQAKGLLFAQLGSSFSASNQNVAVLNLDDPYFSQLETMTAVPVLTYGMGEQADFRAVDVKIHENGADFTLQLGSEQYDIHLQMTGRFSVYNALAAAAATYASGVPMSSIQQSLADIPGVSGRFEKVEAEAPFHVIVDYAHTPDSLKNVLETIKEFAKGKVSVVVGCGGDRDRSKRPQMAAIAEELSDYVYLTSDNPRSEDPLSILSDMEKGMTGDEYQVINSRKEAIYKAVQQAEENEVILIAGKGHETYQIIGDHTYDFDDRLIAKEAIKERS